MASLELSRRAETAVAYPPLYDMDARQRREFHEALLEANAFEDLAEKWQAGILAAERRRTVDPGPGPVRQREADK